MYSYFQDTTLEQMLLSRILVISYETWRWIFNKVLGLDMDYYVFTSLKKIKTKKRNSRKPAKGRNQIGYRPG